MTTLPLSFQINNTVGTIRLYGFTWAITPGSLASNINFVQWDGVTNTGRIYYNDRISIPESFPDPSPYQTYINSWMSGAAAGAAPFTNSLTLAQAQAIKAGLIDSIWAVKRQAPIAVSTSLGNFTFDCNDVNSTSYSLTAAFAIANTAISQCNTINTNVINFASGCASVTTQFNTAFTDIAININADYAALAGVLNGDFIATLAGLPYEINLSAQALVTQLNSNVAAVNAAGIGSNNVSWTNITSFANIPSYTVPNYGTVAAASYSSAGTVPLLNFGGRLLPIGSTSYPGFTYADYVTVLDAINAQLSNELLVRAGKQAALAALGTVAAVIAYDATTGW